MEGSWHTCLLPDSTGRHRRMEFFRKPERKGSGRHHSPDLGGMSMNQNLILIGYIVPVVLGLVLMTPAGTSIGNMLVGRNPLMIHARRRHMLGMNLVAFTGFVVSVHTLWISNKISEGGNVCSTATVFSCDDVLGNAQYNTDPVFGLPWGMIGMLAFGALMFITNSVSKEPDALWAENYLKYGKYMTAVGVPIIA